MSRPEEKEWYLVFWRRPDLPGVEFVIPERLDSWLEEEPYSLDNFIGGACTDEYEKTIELVSLLRNFLGDHITHTKKCRAIKGKPEDIEQILLRQKLEALLTFYKGSELEEWKKRARQNQITEGLTR